MGEVIEQTINDCKFFKKHPICENCNNEPAVSFIYSGRFGGSVVGWKFVGLCVPSGEAYRVDFDRFFRSPSSTVDWLAHLDGKPWKNWPSFGEMMVRFRKQTDSFFELG